MQPHPPFFVSTLASILALLALSTRAAPTVEGVDLDETIMEGSVRLVLNGSAVHKRGYFKTEVIALYLPGKTTDPDVVMRTDGIRVLRRVLLKEIPVATASRYFLNDFKLTATEDEFKQLIPDIGALGGIYGTLKKIDKGDVFDTIWIPGEGMRGRHNGRMLGDFRASDLFYKVFIRMYVGARAHENVRDGLMGLGK